MCVCELSSSVRLNIGTYYLIVPDSSLFFSSPLVLKHTVDETMKLTKGPMDHPVVFIVHITLEFIRNGLTHLNIFLVYAQFSIFY